MGDAFPQEEQVSAFAVHNFLARNTVFLDKNVYTLTTDLFSWLEDEWQLPLLCAELAKPPLPGPVELTKEAYTAPELNHLYGVAGANQVLKRYAIKATGMIANKGRSVAVYSAQDLAPQHWFS